MFLFVTFCSDSSERQLQFNIQHFKICTLIGAHIWKEQIINYDNNSIIITDTVYSLATKPEHFAKYISVFQILVWSISSSITESQILLSWKVTAVLNALCPYRKFKEIKDKSSSNYITSFRRKQLKMARKTM